MVKRKVHKDVRAVVWIREEDGRLVRNSRSKQLNWYFVPIHEKKEKSWYFFVLQNDSGFTTGVQSYNLNSNLVLTGNAEQGRATGSRVEWRF